MPNYREWVKDFVAYPAKKEDWSSLKADAMREVENLGSRFLCQAPDRQFHILGRILIMLVLQVLCYSYHVGYANSYHL